MMRAQALARLRARWKHRRPLALLAPGVLLLSTLPVHAQAAGGGDDSWDNAINVLKTAFTGNIATGLSLVAIVIGGLMFVYGLVKIPELTMSILSGRAGTWASPMRGL